jgi:hypothetical protein
MKKPIHLTWQVKLIIFIFCAAVLVLIYKSFMNGVREGREMKLKQAQEDSLR